MTVRMPGYCKTGTMLYSLTSQRRKGRRGKGGAAKGTKRQGHKKIHMFRLPFNNFTA